MVGVATTYIAFQQHVLAKQQKNISQQQKNIAANKLKLELFEKKYEIYEIHLNMAWWVSLMDTDIYTEDRLKELSFYESKRKEKSDEAEKNYESNLIKLISLGEQVRFLMDEEIHIFLSSYRSKIMTLHNFNIAIRDLRKEKMETPEWNEYKISQIKDEMGPYIENKGKMWASIMNFYSKELPERMMPYLKMPEDISKDGI